jgi:hypothetical protein
MSVRFFCFVEGVTLFIWLLKGVAGFVLGGGYSYFTDQYGLAIDTVVSYDLVLPNGTFIEVNEQSSPDLFFALKVRTCDRLDAGF